MQVQGTVPAVHVVSTPTASAPAATTVVTTGGAANEVNNGMMSAYLASLNTQVKQLTDTVGTIYTKYTAPAPPPSAGESEASALKILDTGSEEAFTSEILSTVDQGSNAQAIPDESTEALNAAAKELESAALANSEAASRTGKSLDAAKSTIAPLV